MKKILLSLAILSTFTSFSFAGSTNNKFTTSANLGSSCTIIKANDLDFGDLTAKGNPTTVSKILDFTVLCSRQSVFNVLLDSGVNHDASNNRMLKATNSSDVIQYGICRTGDFSTSPYSCSAPWWGNTYVYYGTGTGKPQSVSGYIFTRTGYYKPDSYSDTVVTTISF